MLYFIRKLLSRDSAANDFHDTHSRMSLEERMAFRRETLCDSVRRTFDSIGVTGSKYKFKIVPVDPRGHIYILMVDIAVGFAVFEQAPVRTFGDIEALLKRNAYGRFAIVIQSTYWRTEDRASEFIKGGNSTPDPVRSRPRPAPPKADTSHLEREVDPYRRPMQASLVERKASGRLPPDLSAHLWQPTEPLAMQDDEAVRFFAALERGMRPPPVHAAGKHYESDMAPLMDERLKTGTTQYGDLR